MSLIIHFLTKDGIVAISDKRTTVDKDKKIHIIWMLQPRQLLFLIW